MRLLPTPEQAELAKALDDALSRAAEGAGPSGSTRALSSDRSASALLQLGLLEEGGAWRDLPELSAGELVVIFEELGRHLAAGPWVETLAFLPPVIADLDERAKDGIGEFTKESGLLTAVLPGWQDEAVGAAFASKRFIVSEDLLWAAGAGEVTSGIDPSHQLSVLVPERPIHSVPPETQALALDRAALAVSAQTLGIVRRMHELTVSYTKERKQFGEPLSRFQAVRHRAADQRISIDFLRPLIYGAAAAIDAGSRSSRRAVSAARVAAAVSSREVALSALHLHGAIGYTAEYELGSLLLRTEALRFAWGSPAKHRDRVLDSLLRDTAAA